MYTLCCSALGVGDCEFSAAGDTVIEALFVSKAHLGKAHRDMMMNMHETMSGDEIDERLLSVVRTA